ncbi:hypothetical protein CASFOL_030429 [Castilleja foliolosa]|uniref:Uncharacterized protein n=1 Tax=Castilleja foliolosa TaxID=1961234 RepID=A0ABD3CAT8_9LAMI
MFELRRMRLVIVVQCTAVGDLELRSPKSGLDLAVVRDLRIPVVVGLVGRASTEICNVVSFRSFDFGTVNILLVSGGLDDCLLDKNLERWWIYFPGMQGMMLLWTEMLEARSSGADLDEKPGCCWISR